MEDYSPPKFIHCMTEMGCQVFITLCSSPVQICPAYYIGNTCLIHLNVGEGKYTGQPFIKHTAWTLLWPSREIHGETRAAGPLTTAGKSKEAALNADKGPSVKLDGSLSLSCGKTVLTNFWLHSPPRTWVLLHAAEYSAVTFSTFIFGLTLCKLTETNF